MAEIQVIRSQNGEEMVVLPRADYDALVAAAAEMDEDAADLAMYDARKSELMASTNAVLPAKVSTLILEGNGRLKAIRLWRSMTQSELAAAVGIGQGYLSDLEARNKTGSPETVAALAVALGVPVEWID
ncbi:MAG: helix-turn-helix domain-containing protein [Rhizobiaceae bacterium]